MPIFKIEKEKVRKVSRNEDGFGNEAELRDFFAENMEDLLGMRFLEKEYQTPNGRIDTLGIDENNSPVIIEYKWKQNDKVLSQGLFYFDWLIKNKKHFELLVNNALKEKTKINWDSPRVILIAQGFNRYILSAVQQVNNVELKTYTYYEPDILYIENVYVPSELVSKKTEYQKKEAYNLQHHFDKSFNKIQKIAHTLRDRILELPEVEEVLRQKTGITYRTTKSFARFEFRRSSIQLLARDPSYSVDANGVVEDITSNEWGYKGRIKVKSDSNPDYVFKIIRASYKSTL